MSSRGNLLSVSRVKESHANATSSIASPGRFYVSVMAKMIIAHLLLHYEFKLVDESVLSTFTWGVNTMPHPKLRILLRKRSP